MGDEPGRVLPMIQVRMLGRAPGNTTGVPEVNQCSETTDACQQFPMLISYLGACVPL